MLQSLLSGAVSGSVSTEGYSGKGRICVLVQRMTFDGLLFPSQAVVSSFASSLSSVVLPPAPMTAVMPGRTPREEASGIEDAQI
jgi:hypothetical protein